MICRKRNRIEQKDITYALHLYFNCLSLRNTSKALSRFIKRSHFAIRDCWILKYKPERLFFRKIKISEFIIDQTQIKIGSELIWLWVATIGLESKEILGISWYI
jgi:putative transposase